jgi:predicted nuclease of restriction endonuclease-like (RecB) superfamily
MGLHPKPAVKISSRSAYERFSADISQLLEAARGQAARSVNTFLTASCWEIGHRIVEFEQKGRERADYGQALLERLAADLTRKFGRGFSADSLELMRRFYSAWPAPKISETVSRKLSFEQIAQAFPLSWSQYARLLRVDNPGARAFYESESLRGGWSVRQLHRQIESQFYERTALSRDKAAMLKRGAKTIPADRLTPEQEIKNPFILEFLGLKDEYSESELEEALIRHLESFLLELGSDFAFVARQQRLRVGDAWYRVDLVFFHRTLRCLVLIDLKLGSFTHADAGQMHLYLNYAREHWTHRDENPPVGLILCAKSDAAVAHYALEGLPNKILASEYRTTLPAESALAKEINRTRLELETRFKDARGRGP